MRPMDRLRKRFHIIYIIFHINYKLTNEYDLKIALATLPRGNEVNTLTFVKTCVCVFSTGEAISTPFNLTLNMNLPEESVFCSTMIV